MRFRSPRLRAALRFLLGAPALLMVACGSDETATSGGGGAGGGGAGGGGGVAVAACGPGPYARIHATAMSYAGGTIAGARFTIDVCPELSVEADANGVVEVDMTTGMPYNARVDADGFLPLRTGEQILLAELDASGPLLPVAYTTLLPHWSESSPTLVVLAGFSTDPAPTPDPADPCTTADGVTFTVVDHPEAVVTYYSGTSVPQPDATMTATGTLGLAEISGLVATAPGSPVVVEATKTGCAIDTVSYPHTGRYVLENGVMTLSGAFMPPVAAP